MSIKPAFIFFFECATYFIAADWGSRANPQCRKVLYCGSEIRKSAERKICAHGLRIESWSDYMNKILEIRFLSKRNMKWFPEDSQC